VESLCRGMRKRVGGLRGKSSETSFKNHGGVGSASGSGEMT
jgi:hypothetical protein